MSVPAETFHPSVFIVEEMDARGWNRNDLALRMGDFGKSRLVLDLYLDVGPERKNMRIGEDTAKRIAKAFGTSKEFWLNLEKAWLGETP